MSAKQKKLGILLQIFAGMVFMTTPLFFKNEFMRVAPAVVERTLQSLANVGQNEPESEKIISSRVIELDLIRILDPSLKPFYTATRQVRIEFDPVSSKSKWSLWVKNPEISQTERSLSSDVRDWEPLIFRKIKSKWTSEFVEIVGNTSEFKIVSEEGAKSVSKQFVVKMND